MISDRLWRYGFAVGMATAAMGATLAVWPFIQPSVWPIFLLAVIFVAWHGGLGPGLLATTLASLFSAYLFLDPCLSIWVVPDEIEIARWSSLTSGRRQAEELLKRALAQQRALLKERELLLKEIHHRVKNNLQLVSSLLALQACDTDDPRLQESLNELQHRIRSVALVHQSLYQSRDLARQDLAEYLRRLAHQLFNAYNVRPDLVRLRLEVDNVRIGVDRAIPCGLIINELVANALKYAFPAGTGGELTVALKQDGDARCRLVIQDTGVGSADPLDWPMRESFGLQLVRNFAAQLGGSLSVSQEGGTTFSVPAVGRHIGRPLDRGAINSQAPAAALTQRHAEKRGRHAIAPAITAATSATRSLNFNVGW